jgi:hypothetical protein
MKFVLEGKASGRVSLVKTGKDEKSWLLLKKKDRYARSGDILGENRSVVSGRTLEEVFRAGAGQASGRKKVHQIRLREAMESEELQAAPAGPMPHAVKPMLATLAGKPFDHPDWIFEVKWDGYRAVAEIRDGDVSLYSRNLIPLHRKYPPIAEALRTFGLTPFSTAKSCLRDIDSNARYRNRQRPSALLCFDLSTSRALINSCSAKSSKDSHPYRTSGSAITSGRGLFFTAAGKGAPKGSWPRMAAARTWWGSGAGSG